MKKLHGMTVLGPKTTALGPMIRVECDRCAGTGNWAVSSYRVCYKCGGRGELDLDTPESTYNRKAAHVEEVRGIIADETRRLETAPRFAKTVHAKRLEERKVQLVQLEAELAKMSKPGRS